MPLRPRAPVRARRRRAAPRLPLRTTSGSEHSRDGQAVSLDYPGVVARNESGHLSDLATTPGRRRDIAPFSREGGARDGSPESAVGHASRGTRDRVRSPKIARKRRAPRGAPVLMCASMFCDDGAGSRDRARLDVLSRGRGGMNGGGGRGRTLRPDHPDAQRGDREADRDSERRDQSAEPEETTDRRSRR